MARRSCGLLPHPGAGRGVVAIDGHAGYHTRGTLTRHPGGTRMTVADVPARLEALRAELKRHGLAGFLVPRADEHQGEYVPPHAERLAWLTGFTGSAGLAVVLTDAAAIFVDGRYTLQVRQQTPAASFEYHHVTQSPPTDWIVGRLKAGDRL